MAVFAALMSRQIRIDRLILGTMTIADTQLVCSLSGTFSMVSCDASFFSFSSTFFGGEKYSALLLDHKWSISVNAQFYFFVFNMTCP